jgi:hypothetical protein
VQPPGAPSNVGTVSLTPGVQPDPNVVPGTSGGNVHPATMDATCQGWVTQRPDHLFVASAPFRNLKIMAHSGGDTTLIVQRPDGAYLCNDDFEARDPAVLGNFAAGTYKIWVGSYTQGENTPYRLGFTEIMSVNPSSL